MERRHFLARHWVDHMAQLAFRPPVLGPAGVSSKSQERGLTLIELMMAALIGVTVMSLVMSGMNTMSRYLARVQSKGQAADEARLLAEYVVSQARFVGGGNALPFSSVRVLNNWSGGGSDALVLASLTRHNAQALARYPASGRLTILKNGNGTCPALDVFNKQDILVLDKTEKYWSLWYVTGLDTVLCELKVSPAAETGLNYVPSSPNAATAETQVAAVTLKRLWLDETSAELKLTVDSNLDNLLEVQVLADRVVDFQAAMGYDVSPWDWQLSDTGNTDDEWLYNAFGDLFAQNAKQGLDKARFSDLRMLKVAVMVHAPLRGIVQRASLQVFDGPTRTLSGSTMDMTIALIALRNTNIMR